MIIAIQADELETLRPTTDTTLFIASELRKSGYRTFFYTTDKLYVQNGSVYARGRYADSYYSDCSSTFKIIGEELVICLNGAKAVLIRQDPPFDMNYITSLYILELLQKNVVVLNDPTGIRACAEKVTPLHYSHCVPPTMVISSLSDEVREFLHLHKNLILKPLYWFGGKHTELLGVSDEERIELALKEHGTIVLQKFFPEISNGDKRIFIIDGKAEIALKRVPANGQFRANLASGGTAVRTDISAREHEICSEVGARMKKNGIFIAGLDVIAEHLIEVNVTSPTGFVAIDKLYGVNLASMVVTHLEKFISSAI